MTRRFYPFDSGSGASVTQDQWTTMARNWRRSGIAGDMGNNSLKVMPSTATRTSSIHWGEAWIYGHQYTNNEFDSVQHPANNSGKPRVDLVVLRLDKQEDRIEPAVIVGDPADNPVPKAPEGDGGSSFPAPWLGGERYWDIPLAEVRVEAGSDVIPADRYKDVRWMDDFPTVSGASWNKPNTWGMRPWGTLHHEYDKGRWLGWGAGKWGMVAEFGAWHTYRPRIFWEAANGGLKEDTNRWETSGRYRWIADNTITLNIYCKILYDLNESPAPGGAVGHFVDPRLLSVSLPIQAGHVGPVQQMLQLAYWRVSRPGDMRTGHGLIWSGSDDVSRLLIQGPINSDGDVAAGNLDHVNENTPWSRGCHIRLSGTYETVDYRH